MARILAPGPAHGLPRPWSHVLPGTAAALRWLRDHDCGPGTRLALGLTPVPDAAALLQAAILAGCTTILIQQRLQGPERHRLVAAARAQVLMAMATHPLHDQVGVLTVPGFADTAADLAALDASCPASAAALVLATSGTTGPARLVRLSHAAIAHATTAACRRLQVTADDCWLTCLPIDHIGGAGIVLRSLASGCRIDLCEGFDAAAVTARLTAGATIVSLVPTMLHRLVALRGGLRWPATLRCLLIGGGPLSADLIARCTALGLAPCETYGLSEAASQVCTLAPGEAAAHPGSAGRPLDGMELAVRDAGDLAVPAGQDGRLWLRGPALCDGYDGADGLEDVRDAQGWFPTGDVGQVDAEGFLRVLGRHDEVIVSGGENIAPAEVEAVLEAHPAVAQAGVHGVADAEWGQVVCAVLVARDRPVPDAELEAFLLARLSRFKRPRRFTWATTLPMTTSGKLQRSRLATWGRA